MAKGFLISGWRLRIFDENGNPPGTAFPLRVEFFDATTQIAATVYNDSECTVPVGVTAALDAEGYVLDNGVWGEKGISYKAKVTRFVADDLSWETLYTINGLGDVAESEAAGGSDVAFANASAIRQFVPVTDGAIFFLSGYHTIADGGQGFLAWDSDSVELDDGGFCFRPDAIAPSAPGRYIRMFQESELDARWWGCIPDGVVDCAAPLIRCKVHASRIDLYDAPPRIVFSAGKLFYNISGAVVLGGANGRGAPLSWRIRNGTKFSGFATMQIETDSIIECTSPLVWADPNTGAWAHQITYVPGSVPFVDCRWVPTYVGGAMDGQFVYLCDSCAGGIPIKLAPGVFPADTVVFDSNISIVSRLILQSVSLRVIDSASVTLSSVSVEGSPRAIFQNDLNDSSVFLFTEAFPLHAWMFGWGSSSNPLAGIKLAMKCLSLSKSLKGVSCDLIVNGYGVGGLAAPSLTGPMESDGDSVFVKIEGRVAIGAGGVFRCGGIANQAGIPVFIFSGTHTTPVMLANGISHASWFGQGGDAVRYAVASVAGSGTAFTRTVDLDGFQHDFSSGSGIVADIDNLEVRNGMLSASGGSVDLLQLMGENVLVDNVKFHASNGFTGALAWVNTYAFGNASARDRSGIQFSRCRFDLGNSGTGLIVGRNSSKTTSMVIVDGSQFTQRASGALPFVVAGNDAYDVSFQHCAFRNLHRVASWENYGNGVEFLSCKWDTASTAPALLLWSGARGLRFVGNTSTKFGIALKRFTDTVVSDNTFKGQGVIWLACPLNGWIIDGCLVERNTFQLDSIGEWPAPIFVWQGFVIDGSGNITSVVTAFDWTPNTLKLRIADNATNLGFMHQTSIRCVVYGNFLSCLIPLAHFCYFYRVGQADQSTISSTVTKSGANGNGFIELPDILALQQVDIQLSLYGNQPLTFIKP